MIGEGRYIPPETCEIQQLAPTELTSEEDLTEFWLTFRRNNPFELYSPEQERRYATKQAEAMFRELQSKEKKTTFYFGVKDADALVATGKLQVRDYAGEKHGYLSMLAVDEQYRGRKLAKQLTDVRTEVAKREGCTHIDTDVFTGNPTALVTKFNDGYALTTVEFYDETKQAGQFILTKKIDGEPEYDRKKGSLGELRELKMSNLIGIKNLLDQGWVGIDLKNLGDAKDRNPELWNLILEKMTK